LLNQELLTFYGLPARNQRSFVSHAIAKGVFEANSGLKILLAIENGNAIGFLAFSEIFALASCQKVYLYRIYSWREKCVNLALVVP
jgi:hypothetical protein